MKIAMATNAEVNVECPTCYRIIRLDSVALDGLTLVTCPYCDEKSELPKHEECVPGRRADGFKHERVGSPYIVAASSKWQRLIDASLFLMTLSVLFVLFCVLGGGKDNGTYFVGVKRTPGFEHSYINLEPVTVFGMARMEQKLRTNFSYIIVKYHEKSGPRFFERL